ncbi:hypothetical protein N0V84_009714 [Fusarium piperis]|uniref:C2H2-type domain-containing protein n=1 Tax=Fusarium piperis TaxID=1435070 RepID=A0A9W8W5Q7_9HYPO|nr:hypothetical protein N0V84_009714 [Fusarium piperis]
MPDPYLNGHLMEPPQDLAESSQVPEIFFCLHSGCKAKPFKRAADLQRHYRNAHVPEPLKEQHFCDYSRCSRYREPFSRRDHLRDHLRQYHREDIPKRNAVIKKEWLEGRESASSWWRCVRCLARVYVSENDFECPKCKTACEPMRKEKRRQKH